MALTTSQVSVQAIKGKFEQFQEPSLSVLAQKESRPNRIHASPPTSPSLNNGHHLTSPTINHSSRERNTSDFYQNDEIEDHVCTISEEPCRLRSLSVGNPTGHNWRPQTTLERNQSINTPRMKPDPSKYFSRDNQNLGSFAEKQKLVESIVMNIKNTANTEQKANRDQKIPWSKHAITSLFEKDFKEALEKGVKKWGVNRNNREKVANNQNIHLTHKYPRTHNAQQDENDCPSNSRSPKPKSLLRKAKNKFNIDLYPVRGKNKITEENNISNFNGLPGKENTPRTNYLRENVNLTNGYATEYSNDYNCSSQNLTSQAMDNLNMYNNLENQDDQVANQHIYTTISSVSEPIRPPRKRNFKKKSKAPLPPNNFTSVSKSNILHKIQTLNNSGESSLGIDGKRFPNMPPSHQLGEMEEMFPNYNRDPFYSNIDQLNLTNAKTKENNRIYKNIQPMVQDESNNMVSKTSKNTKPNTVLPEGPPPQKPPRTFAHDIYRMTKSVKVNNAPLSNLTPADIEALYTKPIKKSKKASKDFTNEKLFSVSFADQPTISKCLSPVKPAVAPKPLNLSPQKRFSVIEPLESFPQDYSEKPASVKRNSSFRFSFRKSKKQSPSPTRSTQVSKLRDVVKSWNFNRNSEDKFNNRSKSEELLCSNKGLYSAEDPIYATPLNTACRRKGTSQELHYMCSPLFPDNTQPNHVCEKEEVEQPNRQLATPSPPNKLAWGGIKQEFRQSCRMVQKRLKGAVE